MLLRQAEHWHTPDMNVTPWENTSYALEQQSAHPARIHLRDSGDRAPAWSRKSRTEIEHKKQNSDQLLALPNPDCFGRSAENLPAWKKASVTK